MAYKNILCPTDFSTAATDGMHYAAAFAKSVQGTLTLLNVQSLVDYSLKEGVTGKDYSVDDLDNFLQARTQEITTKYGIQATYKTITAVQSMSTAIGEQAREFDLIIMGTDGAEGFNNFLNGSHAYQVIKEATVPVLVVPVGCEYKEIKKIVYAYNFIKDAELPSGQLLPLIQQLNSELLVLQVLEESYSGDLVEDLKRVEATLHERFIDKTFLHFDSIYANAPSKAIHEYIVRNRPEVLALCTRSHSSTKALFHTSAIKKLSNLAEYPLFVFHH